MKSSSLEQSLRTYSDFSWVSSGFISCLMVSHEPTGELYPAFCLKGWSGLLVLHSNHISFITVSNISRWINTHTCVSFPRTQETGSSRQEESATALIPLWALIQKLKVFRCCQQIMFLISVPYLKLSHGFLWFKSQIPKPQIKSRSEIWPVFNPVAPQLSRIWFHIY